MATLAANRSLHGGLLLHSRAVMSWARRGHKSASSAIYPPVDQTHMKKPQICSSLQSFGKKNGAVLSRTGVFRRMSGACENASEGGMFDAKISELPGTLKPNASFKQAEQLLDYEDDGDKTSESLECNVSDKLEILCLKETDSTREIVISEKPIQDAEKVAIELLAGRAFTAVELRKRLRGRKYPTEVVDAVMDDIKNRGLLNDGLYAESFSQSRWLSSTWGPRRIKQALLRKGVSEAEADRATKRVFEDEDGSMGGRRSVEHGMSQSSIDHLFVQASKQWLRGQSLPMENRRARIIRWLQYRGFNWRVTSSILKRLESEYPT